jgi:glycosyltransferase involved in cell wall biosynthesis
VAGDAAVQLSPLEPADWAEAIVSVLTDPHVAAGLRQKGFERAAAFSWTRTALATRDVYREALLA